jgi:hypothetical protein
MRALLEQQQRLERECLGIDYLEAALVHALRAAATLDRRFWLRAALTAFARLPDSLRRQHAPWLTRRIVRAYAVPAT